MPEPVADAEQVVLLVLDGLGWEQLQEHRQLMPTLTSMTGGADHDRRPDDDGDRAELDRHRADAGRARAARLPDDDRRRGAQRAALDQRRRRPPALATRRATCSRSPPSSATTCRWSRRPSCRASAFTEAHLRGSRPVGWRAVSAIAVEVGRQLRAGERFVYAYYGGIDKTAHERGFGEFYDAELRFADRLVADVLDVLPPGAVLLVTADHGQVTSATTSSSPTPSCWRWSPSSRARAGSAGGTPAAAPPTTLAKARGRALRATWPGSSPASR